MRIAIDGLHLFGQYSGVHYSLSRQIESYRYAFPEDELVLFVPRDFKGPPEAHPGIAYAGKDSPAAGSLKIRKTFFPGRWRGIRTLWRNLRLQPNAYAERVDLLHGPTYTLPPILSLPAVLTIHDVIALTHPNFATPGSAKFQKISLPRSVKAANRIHVPTEAVKAQVIQHLKVPAEKIDVIPWGVGEPFKVIDDMNLLENARKEWKLPERFVLYVGTLEPKKNIEGIIKGFFSARVHKKLDCSLVIAGRVGWGMEHLAKLIRELDAAEYVLFTGYVPEAALPLMYNLAEATILLSHIEGFGMPALEAMACGCPVVVSADPALKEVVGTSALVLPHNEQYPALPLREALETWLDPQCGKQVRETYKSKGLEHVQKYTWQNSCKLIRSSYERCIKEWGSSGRK